MALMSSDQYVESLRGLKRDVFILGEKVENVVDHPMVRPSLRAVAETYQLAQAGEYRDLFVVESSLTGRAINRFCHLFQTTDDLVSKVKMQRVLGQKTASCFQRCVGMDAINAVDTVTFEMDLALGTTYHKKFRKYLVYVQDEDLVVGGAMTDPKGDRSLRPSQLHDRDLYLRIVERRSDGIVVRGAKAHQTGILNSHEVLVMPTVAMGEADAEYAVCFAVPTDTKGMLFIYGRQSSDTRRLEDGDIDVGNARYGGHEALIILDDVFVPWDRVFMCGEYQFSGSLVERFAGYHRQSYGGCKVGVGDVLIGAAACMADYGGYAKASHIRDKLIEMVHLNETLYACGIACSSEGQKTPSGTYLVDLLLANVCKQNVTRFPYEIARLAEDIAGGILVTMPSERDFRHPDIGHWLDKYFCGVKEVPTEHRVRMLRLIENLTLGAAAAAYKTESMHGAGSPQAQRIMIGRQTNMEAKKRLAKAIAGISDGE